MARPPSIKLPSTLAIQARKRVEALYEKQREAAPNMKPFRLLTQSEKNAVYEKINPPVLVNSFMLGNALRRSKL